MNPSPAAIPAIPAARPLPPARNPRALPRSPVFPIIGKTLGFFSNHWKNLLALALLPLAAACASTAPRTAPLFSRAPESAESPELHSFSPFDFGPLAAAFTDPDGSERSTAAGPFFESSANSTNYALRASPRPFWVTLDDRPADRSRWFSLWPLAEGKSFGNQRSARILSAYHYVDDVSLEKSKYHFWLLPFWLNGRTADGESYAGLFPIAGTARDFLWRDRYSWFLFPLWMTWSVNDLSSTNILWPVYSRATTPDGRWDRLRVFPFYTRSFHSNHFTKTSILWPFWNSVDYHFTNSHGNAWVFWPFCGRVDLSDQQGWSVLPPLIQVVESEKLRRVYAPWPFYQRESGPYRQKLYFWPFYGNRVDGNLDRSFWLWPFVIHERNSWGRTHRNRWQVVPFWTSVTTSEVPRSDTNAPPVMTARRTKLWPLFSRSADFVGGDSRTRLLDLWPVPSTAVDASWAPFWSLLDYRSSADSSRLDLLWGLYRQSFSPDNNSFSLFPLWNHDRAPDDSARSFSVLHGLFSYSRSPSGSSLRLFWLPSFSISSDPESAESTESGE